MWRVAPGEPDFRELDVSLSINVQLHEHKEDAFIVVQRSIMPGFFSLVDCHDQLLQGVASIDAFYCFTGCTMRPRLVQQYSTERLCRLQEHYL